MNALTIAVLCGSRDHSVYGILKEWVRDTGSRDHEVSLSTETSALPANGDILFLVSWPRIVHSELRDRFKKVLVLHASDLPRGRGWSPHVWEVLGGADKLAVTLLEAAEPVDSGAIWKKERVPLDGTELFDEINAKLFQAEMRLMTYAVENFHTASPQPQSDEGATFYERRTPADSRIHPDTTFAQAFDLLRVCDSNRYPAFFEFRGQRYEVHLKKVGVEREST